MLSEIRRIHSESNLFGKSQDAILDIPDNLLSYTVSLLKDKKAILPNASEEEWGTLLHVLAEHRIIPLLYWKISNLPKENQPPVNFINRIRNTFLYNSVHNLRMENQLREVIRAFEKEGVRVLVYKGIALARAFYPEISIRPGGCDLDLLVQSFDVLRSRKILESLGYTCTTKRFEKSQEIYCEDLFMHKNNNVHMFSVEIHWNIHFYSTMNRNYKIEDFFSRAITIKASNFSFKTLSPVDALIQAVLHMTIIHNQEMRLSWICDIALLLKRLTLDDWKMLQRMSVDWGARIALEKCTRLAGIWFGVEVPPEFSDFSRWPKPMETEIFFWESSLGRHDNPLLLFKLHSLPKGIFQKIRLFFHIFFPAPARIRQSYPPSHPWLLPLSYIRRWIRWIKPLFIKESSN